MVICTISVRKIPEFNRIQFESTILKIFFSTLKTCCLFGCLIVWAFISLGLQPALAGRSAASDVPVKVAAIYALTGEAAGPNRACVEGTWLAAEEINSSGGILGRRLEVVMIDNKSSPIGSNLAAEQAASLDVIAIVGASWSSHSMAIAQVAQARGIPMVSSFSTNPKVTRIGNFIFRVCFTDDFQGDIMARFAFENLKARTALILTNITSDFSMGLAQVFKQRFHESGGRVLQEVEYKPNNTENFQTHIKIAKKADADVLYIPGYDESGLLANLAQQAGVRSIPLGGDGWDNSNFLERGGKYLKRAYFSTHWSEEMENRQSRIFLEKLREKMNFRANAGMVLAYDAMMLLADAVRRAGSPDRNAIRKALALTRGFEGVTGTISLDAQRNPVKSAVIMEIREGGFRYLKTLNP